MPPKDRTIFIQKARSAYEFVRDEIPHTFDISAATITAKASDVLAYKTGICHAKAVLLAALLRSQGIPAGFCFQRVTLMKVCALPESKKVRKTKL